jgi:hypothetical protein
LVVSDVAQGGNFYVREHMAFGRAVCHSRYSHGSRALHGR